MADDVVKRGAAKVGRPRRIELARLADTKRLERLVPAQRHGRGQGRIEAAAEIERLIGSMRDKARHRA